MERPTSRSVGWQSWIHVLIVGLSLAPLIPLLWPLLDVEDRPIETVTWVLVWASAGANLAVLAYHHAVPAHPKFLIVGLRRLTLRVHVWSGTIEFVAAMVAIVGFPNRPAATIVALAALLGHVPSAIIQTQIVFGSRAIMRPAYAACIALHAFAAIMLLRWPESRFWLVATFLIFNIYVWCRVYYFLFDKFGLFAENKYTVAILVAGLTTAPAVLGPGTVLGLGACCATYLILHALILPFGPGEFADAVRERPRDSTHSRGASDLWADAAPVHDLVAARRLFAALDLDRDGRLDLREAHEALEARGVPLTALGEFLGLDAGGGLDFEGFVQRLWPVREVRVHARSLERGARAKSDRDKAAFVFARLDLDGDGAIEVAELRLLLDEWSLPSSDTERWLKQIDVDRNGRIEFDEFLHKLRPLWRFVYHDVVEAKHGPRPDMLVRALSAWRDESRSEDVETTLRRELVAKVDFLHGADEACLADFAACMVARSLGPGEVLCEQGGTGEAFWIVRSGRLRVVRDGRMLAELGPGQWLGEGALLDEAPRAASISAIEQTQVFEVSEGSFGYLLENHPTMARRVRDVATLRATPT